MTLRDQLRDPKRRILIVPDLTPSLRVQLLKHIDKEPVDGATGRLVSSDWVHDFEEEQEEKHFISDSIIKAMLKALWVDVDWDDIELEEIDWWEWIEPISIDLPTLSVVTKQADYTATASDDVILCDASGGAFTVTLPAGAQEGKVYHIKKIDSSGNAVTIAGSIDGETTQIISNQYTSIMLIKSSTEWGIH